MTAASRHGPRPRHRADRAPGGPPPLERPPPPGRGRLDGPRLRSDRRTRTVGHRRARPGSLSLAPGVASAWACPWRSTSSRRVGGDPRSRAAVEHARRAVYGRNGKGRSTPARGPDLEIDVPRGATVVIETASGDLVVDGLTGDQRYRTASGEILLRERERPGSPWTRSPATCRSRAVGDSVHRRPDRLGRPRRCRPSTRPEPAHLDHERRHAHRRPAGRDGPFAIESVSGDTILAPVGGVTVGGQVRHRRHPIGRSSPRPRATAARGR